MNADQQYEDPDDEKPENENPASAISGADNDAGDACGEESGLPEELRNWQVVDGEGHVADDSAPEPAVTDEESSPRDGLETYDDVLILTTTTRRCSLARDDCAVFHVVVQNNSRESLTVRLDAEGMPSGVVLPDLPMRVNLLPGGKQTLGLSAVQKQDTMLHEGDHAFQFVLTAPTLPGHVARISCVLRAESMNAFHVGDLTPSRSTVSWWSPTARTELTVMNLGNHTAQFSVIGADAYRSCLFEFDTGPADLPQIGQAILSIAPLEKRLVGVTILSRERSTLGLTANELPYKIGVEPIGAAKSKVDESVTRQNLDGVIVSRPLIGPWHIAGIAAALAILLLVAVMTSATMLLALRPTSPAAVVAPTQAPAPMIALVLSMNEPVPTSPSSEQPAFAVDEIASPAAQSAPSQTSDGDLPMVQPDQVSAPGAPVPASSAESPASAGAPAENPIIVVSQPTAVAVAPAAGNSMTYGQMFHEVANRYDLSWRLLAAQGYVESSFDSTAVGPKGSMGLMQVHPDTWDEWAPFVDVEDPFDTYSNVLVAAVYLDYLRVTLGQVGYPQTEWMLAAYNWGPDKVLNVLNNGGDWTDLPQEVQEYASDVLQIAQSIPEQ